MEVRRRDTALINFFLSNFFVSRNLLLFFEICALIINVGFIIYYSNFYSFIQNAKSDQSFEFDLELYDNHMIALFPNNKRILIDTGSPATIGDEPLKIGSTTFPVTSTYGGVPVKKLSELVGYKFDCLLGISVMKEFLVEISLQQKKLKFYKRENASQALKGDEYVIDMHTASKIYHKLIRLTFHLTISADTVPSISVQIDDSPANALIDTGAKISYYPRSLTGAYDVVGQGTDFYPTFGSWETTLHAIPVTIGDSFITKFGNLPNTLEQMMLGQSKNGTATAIIGYDLFEHHHRVLFDLQAAKMYLSKETNEYSI